jgi:hypothetical protein
MTEPEVVNCAATRDASAVSGLAGSVTIRPGAVRPWPPPSRLSPGHLTRPGSPAGIRRRPPLPPCGKERGRSGLRGNLWQPQLPGSSPTAGSSPQMGPAGLVRHTRRRPATAPRRTAAGRTPRRARTGRTQPAAALEPAAGDVGLAPLFRHSRPGCHRPALSGTSQNRHNGTPCRL